MGNTDGRLGTIFKILYFVVKKQIAVWVQFQNFALQCKKTNGRLIAAVKVPISL